MVVFQLRAEEERDGGPKHVRGKQKLEVVLHVILAERDFWPVHVQLLAVAFLAFPAYHLKLQSGFTQTVAFLRHPLRLPVRKVNIQRGLQGGIAGFLAHFVPALKELSAAHHFY